MRILIAISAGAAFLNVGPAKAVNNFVSLMCTSSSLAAVHIDIVEDGRSLVVRDRNAESQELYPASVIMTDMIDRVMNEYLRNSAYRCSVTRGTGRPEN